ncbi:hypothetical protein BJY01DRAFT_121743 [Aspergillus pseudoustus]|uniref:Zn(2)-C6 fungal-type domain-containing protein n=1 Tax=Aspergillus pseudoustus TaxID=1810923 RepID=A0ABR4IQE0_9EURO
MLGVVTKTLLRPLLPVHAKTGAEPIVPSKPKRSRQSIACITCQKKRKRCSGSPPCDACEASGTQCVFDPSKDKRRKLNVQQAHETVSRLLDILQHGPDEDLCLLRESIRMCDSRQQAMETLHSFLASIPSGSRENERSSPSPPR